MVDFNPRAVRFSRWNALLNGVQNKVEVYYGDLYHAIDDSLSKAQKRQGRGLFDVILANPPYLPTPPKAATGGSSRPVENAYGDGGVDGERLLAAVMVGARR
jgi:methylase of polypeptide subunit release factors